MNLPETKYARSGDVHIADQVTGDGPLDIILVPGFVSHLELDWESPNRIHFFNRLASFSRLIRFDKRGTGLSDRVPVGELPTLEQRMDDVRAVMDAVDSKRAVLFGVSEGGPMAALFAATYPERTLNLVMYGAFPNRLRTPDYSWAPTEEQWKKTFDEIEEGWGGPVALAERAPSRADDKEFQKAWATYLRSSASPGAVVALWRMNLEIDIRPILPAIHVPTLVLHRTGDKTIDVRGARYMAEHIPGAKFVELPGDDHLFTVGDTDAILDEIEEFLTGIRHGSDPNHVLGTMLFTDIVGSTEKAAALGNLRWRELLEAHYQLLRRELTRFRGREVETTGDGLLATFDGPARAIRCARAMCAAVNSIGLEIRTGLHTGEYELHDNNIAGVAVHLAARVMSKAGANQTLVSSTVKDLVAGSGIQFEDFGMHTLKGISGEWHLYQVVNSYQEVTHGRNTI